MERVAAVGMVKDEADIIEPVVRHMVGQVDTVLVADNGSTDGTREILHGLPVPVTVVDDPEPGYYQSEKMTRLAALAAEQGAEWVVPFDADEWWYSPFGRITDVLNGLDEYHIVTAPLYDHVATGSDPGTGDPVTRMGWRRHDPAPLAKVACRAMSAVVIEQGNHGAHYPPARTVDGQLVVRHFPYRSVEQFVRKVRNGAAAYAATDLPDDRGAHWRQYGALLEAHGETAIGEVFRQWFWSPDPTSDPTLIFDPAPRS